MLVLVSCDSGFFLQIVHMPYYQSFNHKSVLVSFDSFSRQTFKDKKRYQVQCEII